MLTLRHSSKAGLSMNYTFCVMCFFWFFYAEVANSLDNSSINYNEDVDIRSEIKVPSKDSTKLTTAKEVIKIPSISSFAKGNTGEIPSSSSHANQPSQKGTANFAWKENTQDTPVYSYSSIVTIGEVTDSSSFTNLSNQESRENTNYEETTQIMPNSSASPKTKRKFTGPSSHANLSNQESKQNSIGKEPTQPLLTSSTAITDTRKVSSFSSNTDVSREESTENMAGLEPARVLSDSSTAITLPISTTPISALGGVTFASLHTTFSNPKSREKTNGEPRTNTMQNFNILVGTAVTGSSAYPDLSKQGSSKNTNTLPDPVTSVIAKVEVSGSSSYNSLLPNQDESTKNTNGEEPTTTLTYSIQTEVNFIGPSWNTYILNQENAGNSSYNNVSTKESTGKTTETLPNSIREDTRSPSYTDVSSQTRTENLSDKEKNQEISVSISSVGTSRKITSSFSYSTVSTKESTDKVFDKETTYLPLPITLMPNKICDCTQKYIGLVCFSSTTINVTHFNLSLNTNDKACEKLKLSGIKIDRYGPITFRGTATLNSTCETKEIDCHDGKICSFNCAFDHESFWSSCGNYSLNITPENSDYQSFTCHSHQMRLNVLSLLSGNDIRLDILNVSASKDSFLLQWSVYPELIYSTITDYEVQIQSLANNSSSQTAHIALNCTKREKNIIVFDSNNCSSRLNISPCNNYSIKIKAILICSVKETQYSLAKNFSTYSGDWGEIKDAKVYSTEAHALTLEWSEPQCASSVGFEHYNITVTSRWSNHFGKQEKFVAIVPRSCLIALPHSKLSVKLNESMCNNQSVKLRPCAPYSLNVTPKYVLNSDEKTVTGWKYETRTEPPEGLNANFTILDKGTRWFLLGWNQPRCRLNLTKWTLEDHSLNQSVLIPASCLSQGSSSGNQTNDFLLKIGDESDCFDIKHILIEPCSEHNISLKYELSEIGSIFTEKVSEFSLFEDPRSVSVDWNSTTNKIDITWSPPDINPRCVSYYQILWNGNKSDVYNTSITFDDLEACKKLSISIIACYQKDGYQNESVLKKVEVSTNFKEPALVDAKSIHVNETEGWLTWKKPDDKEDDCIVGYEVYIRDFESHKELFRNGTTSRNSTKISFQTNVFKPDKSYVAHIMNRMSCSSLIYRNGRSVEKVFMWKSSPGSSSFVAAIVLPVSCVVCIAIFIILFVFLRKRRNSSRANENTDCEIEVSVMRKPIPIQDFNQALAILEADSGYELSKEYEEVKVYSAVHPCVAAKKPENQDKNRYLDILPFDHSRVKLRNVQPDYINASFIKGERGTKEPQYIAAQGPKPNTVEHFWRMCLEQEVRVIVALTTLEERGRIKCAQYWPTEGTLEFGPMRVELVSKTQRNLYTERKFSLSVKGERTGAHLLYQLHYTDWPDFGCPEKPENLIELVYAMRKENFSFTSLSGTTSPTVVHCSAGVGRTGTLIVLDLLMKEASQKGVVDVVGTTLGTRQDRAKMVQNEDQYRFLYRCLNHYINRDLFRKSL